MAVVREVQGEEEEEEGGAGGGGGLRITWRISNQGNSTVQVEDLGVAMPFHQFFHGLSLPRVARE